MHELLSVVAPVAPVVQQAAPTVHEVVRTVTVETNSHLYQLAQIIEFLGTGVGLSVMHSLIERGRLTAAGLKWLNVVLVPIYCAVMAIVELYLKGSLDITDWYMVFTQVLAGAVTWFAILTAVNKAAGSGAPAKTAAPAAVPGALPISENP